ncbi:hypothetical protein [Nannocystis punicea]|uniref:Uncharacterized protein n=1 Tax=Nannocystis punicea TaxID=2995304 RepID=A0ABY7HFQ5_9BACT|nr:hypothetical protein [Nannocystis poenicansa]WAS97895.1 hypothetical protein O0S08_17275 [Nannocystis poenicansa]
MLRSLRRSKKHASTAVSSCLAQLADACAGERCVDFRARSEWAVMTAPVFPPELSFVGAMFERFGAASKEEVHRLLKAASVDELDAVTAVSIRLLERGAAGMFAMYRFAEQLENRGEHDSARRIRAFTQGIMPVVVG